MDQPANVFVSSRKHYYFMVTLSLLLIIFVTMSITSVNLMNTAIYATLPLKPSGISLTLANWLTIPFPIVTKFYFFNVTNPHEVLNGSARPILKELGPFVFEETRNKINLTWANDLTSVEYNQTRKFKYRSDLSTKEVSINDYIYHLNVPLVSAAEYARRAQDEYIYYAIETLIEGTGAQVFEKHSMAELLFEGYEDPLLNETSWIGKYEYDKFGWMYGRNGTSTDGRYTIATGVNSLYKIGQVIAWNNKTTIDGYSGECSYFDSASAGDLFPPKRKSDSIEIFVGDTCRPIELFVDEFYQDETYIKYLSQPATFAGDSCYCVESPCPPNGVANISACKSGSPAFISLPHFLYGDTHLIDHFEGLSPNESKHGFSFILDDKLGIPLSVHVAMQLNVALVKNDRLNFTSFQSAETVYYPTIYFISTADVSAGTKIWIDFLHFTLPILLIVLPAVAAINCLIHIIDAIVKIVKIHRRRGELRQQLIERHVSQYSVS